MIVLALDNLIILHPEPLECHLDDLILLTEARCLEIEHYPFPDIPENPKAPSEIAVPLPELFADTLALDGPVLADILQDPLLHLLAFPIPFDPVPVRPVFLALYLDDLVTIV